MIKRAELTQWQILVIEQLLNNALEFQKHKYDETSLKHLVDTWTKADKVKILIK